MHQSIQLAQGVNIKGLERLSREGSLPYFILYTRLIHQEEDSMVLFQPEPHTKEEQIAKSFAKIGHNLHLKNLCRFFSAPKG